MKKDFESSSNGGFDDGNSPEIHCSEEEWAQYVAWADSEAVRFRNFYETLEVRDGEDRLDKCALAMGWQLDGEEEALSEEEVRKLFGADFKIFSPPGPIPVYSLLNMTEVVALRGMIESAQARLQAIFSDEAAGAQTFPREKILCTAVGFSRAEQSMMLAIDALSAREYALATLQMKRALRDWNEALGVAGTLGKYAKNANGSVPKMESEVNALFQTIFDLRELCLRIIRDAREAESEERNRDSEN